MGTTLEVAKLVCATWIKANWERVPFLMKTYMCTAVVVLMIITSMGIFGFLSKAHLDQNLVSGDVIDKIAIYDEKIKTEKENIESNRKALKQMDATIDETIARSKTDQGAVNANAMRQRQAKERTQIQADIAKSQKTIAALNEERAPIAKEVRKVEAEVGPIKYIAALIYGANPDATVLEKAVTWVIIMLVTVFDPLAIIMLLAAQMSFAWFKQKQEETLPTNVVAVPVPAYEPDDGPLTEEQIEQIKETVIEPNVPYTIVDEHHEPDYPEPVVVTADSTSKIEEDESSELDKWNKMIEEAERQASEEATKQVSTVEQRVAKGETYIDNQGTEIALEVDLPETEESKKKTYMIKDQEGKIQVKNREL